MLVKHVQRPPLLSEGIRFPLATPVNSETGPDHAVHVEEEKSLKDSHAVNDLLSMIMNFF